MFISKSKSALRNALAQAAAIGKSQAMIELNLDGTIITANPNFLAALGYSLDETKGKHHSAGRAAPALLLSCRFAIPHNTL